MTPKEALQISREVGEEVRKAVEKLAGKKESNEIVGLGKDGTPTKKIDKVAEDVAISVLRNYDVKIVSEEAGVVGDGNIYVALDPIDGTFNATRGIPIYSVSLCFSKSELLGDAFFGYVLNLATGVEYYGMNGKAYKNGERIEVSKKSKIENCDAILYYPTKRYGFKRLRIFGSAALELCFVADGSVDCFMDIRNGKGFLRIYDVAAGILIGQYAGAKATDLEGNDLSKKRFSMDERLRLVVANPELHKKLLELVK
jgi:myo-inositol-1(or 4)-monophosphatase